MIAIWALFGGRRGLPGTWARFVVERNVLAYRRHWLIFLSGFAEPLFYLLSIGLGLGALVGSVPGPGGAAVPYADFVAPAMLAASAMNGAVIDGGFNVFFRLRYQKAYDAMLATPLRPADVAVGEVIWALSRGTAYAAAFLVTMWALGLIGSPWAVLALPAAVLTGFAFAAVAMAAATAMRTWQDFDYLNVATLLLFLFSATFYPLTTYPPVLRIVVQASPLYQAVALMRVCTLARPGWGALGHAGYLLVLGLAGVLVAGRRLARLMHP